ncbi:MAG: thiamine diphosphokinase [Clostridia bacterium]|nr:thiamine diphosphokinase [Clostridia bacterium]
MKVAIILNCPNKSDLSFVTENKVIYTDGGYAYKNDLKDKTTLAVVGDFDTLKKIPEGENVVRLEREKNFTDGERAVYYAKQTGAQEVCIYGAFGGKPEHILGNLTLLKIAQKIGLSASIKYGGRVMKLLTVGDYEFNVKNGGSVSLIPTGENASLGKSEGLYYQTDSVELTPFDTRGISNLAENEKISVSIKSGEVYIIYEY